MTVPNILLIIFDDMTCEQLQRMPQLMKLAKTGVNFLSAYTTTPLCQPARTTLLTGQYAHNHGAVDNLLASVASLDTTTMLSKRLQSAGYKTCHVGKYNNAYSVADTQPSGWDEWHAIAPQQYFGFSINDDGVTTTKGAGIGDYHTNVVNNRAQAFITSTTQPFFMQVSFHCPHNDNPTTNQLNATPSPVYTGVMGSKTAPRNPNFNVKMGSPPAYLSHTPMDAPTIAAVDAFWRGQSEMLFSADRAIADIAAALVTAGKTNTVIIVTSDHGYFHGEGIDPAGKTAPYLPAMRIPLIVSGPSAFVSQDKVCSALVGNVDIAPTIYALSGASSTRTMDGVSLAPLLTTPTGPELRTHLMLEWQGAVGGGGVTGWNTEITEYHSILSKQYLYTLYSDAEQELYDLTADPFQLVNQIGVTAYAAVQSDLASRLSGAVNCTGSGCVL